MSTADCSFAFRDADMELLSQLACQVDLALSGAPSAYDDRAGETCSL